MPEELKRVYIEYRYIGIEFVGGNYHIVITGPSTIVPTQEEFIDHIQEFEDSMRLLKDEVEKRMEKLKKQEEEDRIKRENTDRKLLEIYERYEE